LLHLVATQSKGVGLNTHPFLLYLNMKTKEIDLPMFDTSVVLCLDKTTEKICALMRDSVSIEHEDAYEGFCVIYMGKVYVFIVDSEKYKTVNTITHEIYHAVNKLWALMGADSSVNPRDHEPLAYLNGYLNEIAFKFYKPKK